MKISQQYMNMSQAEMNYLSFRIKLFRNVFKKKKIYFLKLKDLKLMSACAHPQRNRMNACEWNLKHTFCVHKPFLLLFTFFGVSGKQVKPDNHRSKESHRLFLFSLCKLNRIHNNLYKWIEFEIKIFFDLRSKMPPLFLLPILG